MKNVLMCVLSVLCLIQDARPNVVVVVVDQLSYWATDPAQRAPLDMPNLDALSAQGRVYTRAYTTSPVCSENRLALLTGRYPFSLGTNKLSPGVDTIAHALKAHGWDTGYVGKWHLSPVADPTQYVHPADRTGWDFFAGKEGQPHYYITGSSFVQNTGAAISTAPWEPSWNTQKALRFLRANRTDPFFLVVNYGPPHGTKDHALMPPNIYTPSQITTRPNVSVADEGLAKAKICSYMSACVLTDVEIGYLMSEIDLTTTYVVFTSDHGDTLYSHGLAFNQQKRRPWQECANIPLVFAGPGISPGTDDTHVSTVDVFPVIMALVGLPVPDSVQGALPVLGSLMYYGHGEGTNSWLDEEWRGVVMGDFKYAVTESGVEVLFDLSTDPYEMNDLSASAPYSYVIASLQYAAQTKASEIGDPFFSVPESE